MAEISLEVLVDRLKTKRAGKGIREAAAAIGVSPATLSRVERGNLPDLETFKKICSWVQVDPGKVLGYRPAQTASPEARVHFKGENTLSETTAKALADLIIAAEKEMRRQEEP